jgi:hypothetical protein
MLVNQGDHPKLVSSEASRQPPLPRLGLPQLRLAARIYQLLTPLQWQMFGSIFGFFIVRHICNAQGCQPPMNRAAAVHEIRAISAAVRVEHSRPALISERLSAHSAVLNEVLTGPESGTRIQCNQMMTVSFQH